MGTRRILGLFVIKLAQCKYVPAMLMRGICWVVMVVGMVGWGTIQGFESKSVLVCTEQ